MRNFKRLVASLLATMMVMGVSAFASEPTIAVESTDTTYFESYTGGEVILKSGALTTEGQLTVVIIPADKADATLTDADILYINQGTNGDTFWTDGMGTIVDFTTLVNADNTSDEYIIRIGGTNIGAGVIEIPMTVTWTAGEGDNEDEEKDTVYGADAIGDVNGDGGLSITDVTTLIGRMGGTVDMFVSSTTQEVLPLLIGDVNNDNVISVTDVTSVIGKMGGSSEFARESYTLPAGTTAESTYN